MRTGVIRGLDGVRLGRSRVLCEHWEIVRECGPKDSLGVRSLGFIASRAITVIGFIMLTRTIGVIRGIRVIRAT